MPMILFQLQPALGGRVYTTETLQKLITIPTVTAIVEASFDACAFTGESCAGICQSKITF